MAPLKGQIAVITGASSGIGKALALGLAAEGVTVCLVGRRLETLEVVAERARRTAPRVLSYQVDLTKDGEIRNLATALGHDFERLDMLIHSAGVISPGRIDAAPVQDLDWQYRTNVRAPYVLTQALLPLLRARQGQIVFINSSIALNSKANIGQYAASKHALKAIADSLREEINPEGLRVMSVFPGRTATPQQESLYKIEGRTYQPELLLQPEDVAAVVINALTLPRTAEVTDISIRPLTKSY